jgi:mRNA interferase MazF
MVKDASTYVPKRGDFIWLNFDPRTGHEQSGHRPALVISPEDYNRIGRAIVCPITSRLRGFPFEVRIPDGEQIAGVILTDQIRAVDWRARKAEFIVAGPASILEDAIAKLATLIFDD